MSRSRRWIGRTTRYRWLLVALCPWYQAVTASSRWTRRESQSTIASVIEDARVGLLRRYWDEAWSQGNEQVLSEVYAPRFRENNENLTPEQFSGHLLRWREKFPDFRAELERFWLTDSAVTTRVIYTGIHLGDFRFLPATGRRVRSSGLDVFEFNGDGRVVQHWHETDHWDLFEQLGLGVPGS